MAKSATAAKPAAPPTEVNGKGETGLTVQVSPQHESEMALAKVFEVGQVVQAAATHNFPDDKFARVGLRSLAKSAECKPMDEMPESGIQPQYFYLHVVQINKQNFNGVVPAIRTVLIDREGNAWQSLSEQVARDLGEFIAENGAGEIDPAYNFKLQSIKAGKGKVHKLLIST